MNKDKLKQVMIEDINNEQNFEHIMNKIQKRNFPWIKLSSTILVVASAFLIFFQPAPPQEVNDEVSFSFSLESDGYYDYLLDFNSKDVTQENQSQSDYDINNYSYNLVIEPLEVIDMNPKKMFNQAQYVVKANLQKMESFVDEKGMIYTNYDVAVLETYKGKAKDKFELSMIGGTVLTSEFIKIAPQVSQDLGIQNDCRKWINTYFKQQFKIDEDVEFVLFLNQDYSLIQSLGILKIENQTIIDLFGNQYEINR